MQENTLSYEEIIEYFTKKTVEDRYKYLYDKMFEYITERNYLNQLFIDKNILHQVVLDYFVDIYRLKNFHKIEFVNDIKIVSYEVYWLLRRKPIQIRDEQLDSKLVFANEGFATILISHELLAPEETEPLGEEAENKFLELMQHINYHLKYRNVDKQCIEIMIDSFMTGKAVS